VKKTSVRFLFSQDMLNWLKANSNLYDYRGLTDAFNKQFNTVLKLDQIRDHAKYRNIKVGIMCKRKNYFFTPDKIEYIRQLAINNTIDDITKKFNEYYKTNKSKDTIGVYASKYKIKIYKSKIGREVKKGVEIYIRVSNTGNPRKDYVTKHRYLWEQKNGKVPNGYLILFANGNKQDFNLDNLLCVKNSELIMMSKMGCKYDDIETTKTFLIMARLTLAMSNRIKKEVKGDLRYKDKKKIFMGGVK